MDNTIVVYLVAAGILIFVIILFTRWLFKIDSMEACQKSTMFLLKNIAEKSGVDSKAINDSMKPYNDMKKGMF